MSDALWSIQELARYLGVPVRTIYAWRYKREGPPGLRLGKHLRFRPGDVQEWLATLDPDVSGARASVPSQRSERMA